MDKPLNISGLILAGGDSRRMGRPKACLELDGQTMIGRVLNQLEPICREIFIVTRHPEQFTRFRVKIVRDLVCGQGPLGGLATGLFYAHNHWSLAVACDLPFLNPALLTGLAQKALTLPDGPRALVPKTDKGWEPLIAVYSRQCIKPVSRLLARGWLKLEGLQHNGVLWHAFSEEEIRTYDPGMTSLTNINTPQDLDRARTDIKS